MNKQGKRPIAERKATVPVTQDEIFSNLLTIDPELQTELDRKGLVGRFIDAKKLYEMNGYHKAGWVPYKREAGTMGLQDFKFGSDPDGIVRRGTLILAVKTKENHARHKAYLAQRAELYSTVQKQKADELRALAKDSGLQTQVVEGYDDKE